MGEFLFHVFGALAQYERSLIRERVNAGLEAARQRGRKGGRPRCLDTEKMEAALALLASGMTVTAAARSIGVPRSTLVDSLNRAGKLVGIENSAQRPAENAEPVSRCV